MYKAFTYILLYDNEEYFIAKTLGTEMFIANNLYLLKYYLNFNCFSDHKIYFI